jgi:hypothetical protein
MFECTKIGAQWGGVPEQEGGAMGGLTLPLPALVMIDAAMREIFGAFKHELCSS